MYIYLYINYTNLYINVPSDVPIVQAKHHYEKTNEDDLELTKGEIYRVLKKYTDGMYKKISLYIS